MSTQSLWRRLSDVIRGVPSSNGNGHAGRGENGENGSHDSSVIVALGEKPAAGLTNSTHDHGISAILPWKKPGLERLRDDYGRVLNLLDSLQTHFERQDRRSEQMNDVLARIAGAMDDFAAAQRVQGESIASIAGAVDAARQTAKSLSGALGQMPASMAAQAEAVRAIARQMESAHATEAQMVESLQRFGVAVDTLRESGAAQVGALQRMRQRDDEHQEALKGFIKDQNRRMLFVLTAAVLSAAAAVAVGVVILLREWPL